MKPWRRFCLYPEERWVDADKVIGWAVDARADEIALELGPGEDDGSDELHNRILDKARDEFKGDPDHAAAFLSDRGLATFRRDWI